MLNSYSQWFEFNDGIVDPEILHRLSRHLALAGWDYEFQVYLDSNSILVVGAGGLGSTLCMLLAGSLFRNKKLTIVDPDSVELSNLHRQTAFTQSDIGHSKAERLAEFCRNRNSTCNVLPIVERVTERNGPALIQEHDIIFDCTDNVCSRILLSDLWHKTARKKHLISGSCVGWCGQLLNLVPGNAFCLRCVYGKITEDMKGCDRLGQCALQGVMAPVVSVVASMQLIQYINHLKSPTTDSSMSLVDFSSGSGSFRQITVSPSCNTCLGVKDDVIYNLGSSVEPQLTDSNAIELDGKELLTLLENDACKIIDVRERKHYWYSHFKNSLNLPASEFVHSNVDLDRVESLKEIFSSSTYTCTVVVCRRGKDSLRFAFQACEAFPGRKILSLRGGLQGLALDIV